MRFSILVVDDEPSVCESLQMTLEDFYSVRTALSVREALACLETWHFDLILLDYKMPGMTGLDFLKRIAHSWPQVPVIMITATTDIGLALHLLHHGAVDYLSKPFDVDKILQLVQTVLERRSFALHMEWQQRQRAFLDMAPSMAQLHAWLAKQEISTDSDACIALVGGTWIQRLWLALQYYNDTYGPEHPGFYIEKGINGPTRAGLLTDGLWLLDQHHVGLGEISKRVQAWEAEAALPAHIIVGLESISDQWLQTWQGSRPLQVWHLPVAERRVNEFQSWPLQELKQKIMGST